MAVHKAIRSHSSAQVPRRRPDRHLKSEIFETFHQLNRGFAIALAALDRLEHKDRLPGPRIFTRACLRNYRNRTETLRASANHDLLRLLAGHEERDATRFSKPKHRS